MEELSLKKENNRLMRLFLVVEDHKIGDGIFQIQSFI